MEEFFYENDSRKPVDKKWVEQQFENFWEQIKNYIDTNVNCLHLNNDKKIVFTIDGKDVEIATIPQN
jgi:hypothetical protein